MTALNYAWSKRQIVAQLNEMLGEYVLAYAPNPNPGTTDMAGAIQAADDAVANGGIVHFPAQEMLVGSTIEKSPISVWQGVYSNSASGQGTEIRCGFNGTLVDISGTGTNEGGDFQGLRLIVNPVAYPDAVGIHLHDNVVDHYFNRLRVGAFDYGIKQTGPDGAAYHFRDCYIFSAGTDGMYFENSTDHTIFGTQTNGDEYGLHLVTCGAVDVIESRPQVSGLANAFVDDCHRINFIGGYNDTGDGIGLQIRDSGQVKVTSVQFFANGDGWPHIFIYSSPGETCQDLCITANTFYMGSSLNDIGIAFGAEIALTGVSGTFVRGEIVTGGTSGNTAKVVSYNAGTARLVVMANTAATGAIQAAETITGGTSGATATAATVGGQLKDVSILGNDLTGVTIPVTGLAYVQSGLQMGFNNGVAAFSAYSTSNVTTTRTFDADTVTLPQLADVVGTMIADFKAKRSL